MEEADAAERELNRGVTTHGGQMHPHALLLERLFMSLNQHDDRAISECYHADATFSDIAFDLHGKREIHDMWRMICAGDIRVSFEVLHVDDAAGHVNLLDEYTFGDTGRKVRNAIDSRFRFANGLVVEQRDVCDARVWAAMAIGGPGGFVAGRIAPLRRFKARRKLQKFVEEHPR